MAAKNMKELNKMLMKEMRKALSVSSEKALADMYEETGDFYTKDEPKKYKRTGALGDTPKTTSVSTTIHGTGGEASFEAYLDTDYQYTTGKRPSMKDVLNLANYGISPSSPDHLRDTVGKKGFWERAESKMEKSFEDTMQKYFKKI